MKKVKNETIEYMTKFSVASFALFRVKCCVTRPNDFPLLIYLGFWELSLPSCQRRLYCHANVTSYQSKPETYTLTFIPRYSRLLSLFRTVQHYYK